MKTEPLPPLQPFAEYVALRGQLSREAFVARLGGPVLLIPLAADAPAAEDEFRTSTAGNFAFAKPGPAISVALVQKRSADAFQNFIWVGREARCDVCIPLESVSKLQAQFTRKPDGSYDLLDVGSTNGTWVAGVKLERNKPAQVKGGDRIRFGSLEVRFLLPDGFYDELGR